MCIIVHIDINLSPRATHGHIFSFIEKKIKKRFIYLLVYKPDVTPTPVNSPRNRQSSKLVRCGRSFRLRIVLVLALPLGRLRLNRPGHPSMGHANAARSEVANRHQYRGSSFPPIHLPVGGGDASHTTKQSAKGTLDSRQKRCCRQHNRRASAFPQPAASAPSSPDAPAPSPRGGPPPPSCRGRALEVEGKALTCACARNGLRRISSRRTCCGRRRRSCVQRIWSSRRGRAWRSCWLYVTPSSGILSGPSASPCRRCWPPAATSSAANPSTPAW